MAKASKKGPAKSRPLVLLSNDDGYRATGIETLRARLQEFADVILFAPEFEQSAMSHALTLHRPLRLHRIDDKTFALDGTPADCVYLALIGWDRWFKRRPDFVVSGINHGPNLGQDVFYSGTVAAAREGAFRGLPSFALSAHRGADHGRIADWFADFLAFGWERKVLQDRGPSLLSLNFPDGWKAAVEVTRLGATKYEDLVDFRTDPRGREYAWIGGPPLPVDAKAGTDSAADAKGVASISLLSLDQNLVPPQNASSGKDDLDAFRQFVRSFETWRKVPQRTPRKRAPRKTNRR